MTERSGGGDLFAAVLFLILQLVGVGVCGVLGITLVFVSDACGTTDCNDGLILGGMAITGLVPAALWFVSLVHVVVRYRRPAQVWFVPLLWTLASAAVAAVGIAVAFAGGPDSFS